MENCVLVEVRSWNVYSGDENDWVYGIFFLLQLQGQYSQTKNWPKALTTISSISFQKLIFLFEKVLGPLLSASR